MSVIKRGNSKYWYIQFQFNSRTFIRSSRTTVKKAAEQLEVEWKAKLHAQEYLGRKERITLRDAIHQFCESKKGTPNHRNLVFIAKSGLGHLPVSKYLDELTLHDLERYKREREAQGISQQTIKHSLNTIRGAWKYARRLGYQVSDLEFPVIKVPKYKLRYLSEEEEKRLLAELDPRRDTRGLPPFEERHEDLKQAMIDCYDLVVMLLDTGARYSEIAKIEWRQINLESQEIYLWRPKVQNETVLYMTERVREILVRRKHQPQGHWVFQNKKGGPRNYASIAIRKALRRAGLTDCRIHTLRHTLASRLVQNGLSVYEVREILGHTDIKTTMRYAHLEQRQVASKARNVLNKLNCRN